MDSTAPRASVIEKVAFFDLNSMGDAPRGTDRAFFLRAEFDPLQLKMLVEGMNGPVTPDEVVLADRVQEFGALGQPPRDGVEDEAGVERGDEGDVDGEAGGILDLGDLQPIDLFALLLGDQIDLADALAERRALQFGFEAGEAGAVGRPIGEHFAADAPREDAADDKGDAVAD